MRRFRYKSAEYDQVHAWIKKGAAAAADEEERGHGSGRGVSVGVTGSQL